MPTKFKVRWSRGARMTEISVKVPDHIRDEDWRFHDDNPDDENCPLTAYLREQVKATYGQKVVLEGYEPA